MSCGFQPSILYIQPSLAVLPVGLQAVPQTVVVMADGQTELLPFRHPALHRQEVNTLHPVVPPLQNSTVLTSEEDCRLNLTIKSCFCVL